MRARETWLLAAILVALFLVVFGQLLKDEQSSQEGDWSEASRDVEDTIEESSGFRASSFRAIDWTVDGLNFEVCGKAPAFKGWPDDYTRGYCAPLDTPEIKFYDTEEEEKKNLNPKRPKNYLPRMSGGYNSRRGEFPSYVALEFKGPGSNSICGGVLIGHRHVLTSASCIPMQMQTGRARMGLWGDLKDTKDEKESFVKWVCDMDEYDNLIVGPHNDVALVLLDEHIEYTDYIQPACLGIHAHHQDRSAVITVGNGFTQNSGPKAKKVRALPMKLGCSEYGQQLDIYSRSCYQSHVDGYLGQPCLGDWGGPLYAIDRCNGSDTFKANFRSRQYLVGLASFGRVHGCVSNAQNEVFFVDLFRVRDKLNRLLSSCHREMPFPD